MTLIFALLIQAHALTDAQKRAVIEAVENHDYAILDQLTFEEEAHVTKASTLEITQPGTYDIRGYDRVELGRKFRGQIVCPTCPAGRTMYCR